MIIEKKPNIKFNSSLFFILKNIKNSKKHRMFFKTKFFNLNLNILIIKYFIFYKIFLLSSNLIYKSLFIYSLKNSLNKKNFKFNIFLKANGIFNNFKFFKNVSTTELKIKKIRLMGLKIFKLNLYFLKITTNYNNLVKKNLIKSVFININKLLINYYFLFSINKNVFINKKKYVFNSLTFLRFFINLNDYNNFNIIKNNLTFFSNKYLIKYLNFYDNEINFFKKNSNWKIYNNYYPIVKNDFEVYKYFNKKFEFNRNLNYSLFTNRVIIKFLENILKKKIYVKIINNHFYKIKNKYFNKLINDYKNFKPLYFKNFLITDFIEILWYSFWLKDLKMISNWISKFMETLNFKNHKKFISFFNNFINRYSSLFMDVLGVKGFFFDIRGKVGVTGSSKKRHLCFKFGSLKKSSKKNKINFNQNLVRTYSGVMGLTYIINY